MDLVLLMLPLRKDILKNLSNKNWCKRFPSISNQTADVVVKSSHEHLIDLPIAKIENKGNNDFNMDILTGRTFIGILSLGKLEQENRL